MNILSRIFKSSKSISRNVDSEISKHQATLRQNAQVVQSGARVVESMSGAMRILMELDREKNS